MTKQTTHTAGHTPTPYSISGITGDNHLMARYGHTRRTIAIFTGYPNLDPDEFEATKQFVANACNSHDDLVEVLEGLILRMESEHARFPVAEQQKRKVYLATARNALAKAKATGEGEG